MNIRNQNIEELILSYCKGELPESERELLEQWLNKSDENKKQMVHFLASYRESREYQYLDEYDEDISWENLEKRLIVKPVSRSIIRMPLFRYSAAAVVVGMILMSVFRTDIFKQDSLTIAELAKPGEAKAFITLADGNIVDIQEQETFTVESSGSIIKKDSSNRISYESKGSSSKELRYNTITVPTGGEYKMILSDGTEVWFNSETKMKFPVEFVGSTRKVELQGEAFFKVAHNKSKPFIVRTKHGATEVLGTEFNVRAYREDNFSEVTLVEGSVRLSKESHSVILKPGIQGIISEPDEEIETREVDVNIYTSWVKGVFEFENENLQDIAISLGRWYSVSFEFDDEALKDFHFTGVAKRYEPIEKILGMIEKTAGVSFVVDNNIIRIARKEKN